MKDVDCTVVSMLVLRTHSSVKVCALEHWAYWDLDDG